MVNEWRLYERSERFRFEFHVDNHSIIVATMKVEPLLIHRIKQAQPNDRFLMTVKSRPKKNPNFQVLDDGILRFRGRLCIPKDKELRREILEEAHRTAYKYASWKYEDVS